MTQLAAANQTANQTTGDEIKSVKNMAKENYEEVMSRLDGLDAALKSNMETTQVDAGAIQSLSVETKSSLVMMEKKIANMNNSMPASLDSTVSMAVQEQLGRAIAPVEDRVASLHNVVRQSVEPLDSKFSKLQTQLRETQDKVESLKMKSEMSSRQTGAQMDQKLSSMSSQLAAFKEEAKREMSLTMALEFETKVQQMLRENTSQAEKTAIAAQKLASSLERKLASLSQTCNESSDQVKEDRERLEYCCRMIFTYGVQIIKESDVRNSLRDLAAKLCTRVAALETKSGIELPSQRPDLAALSTQEAELNAFNGWLAKTHHITPKTRFRPPATPEQIRRNGVSFNDFSNLDVDRTNHLAMNSPSSYASSTYGQSGQFLRSPPHNKRGSSAVTPKATIAEDQAKSEWEKQLALERELDAKRIKAQRRAREKEMKLRENEEERDRERKLKEESEKALKVQEQEFEIKAEATKTTGPPADAAAYTRTTEETETAKKGELEEKTEVHITSETVAPSAPVQREEAKTASAAVSIDLNDITQGAESDWDEEDENHETEPVVDTTVGSKEQQQDLSKKSIGIASSKPAATATTAEANDALIDDLDDFDDD
eukprot:CAMPEP_0197524102 /NCGR_PEP_ID=MMETSP1318-20131121/8865_1 /TAXON_ID=552666 /ORGANISM="Partenskyella glossopodia, Strain RCC365" /LENGTH=601 /DNA_ID=CAMNT_0043076967 /DNA_START=117 /DNA_END=1922 /DNA_ORIENTATION=-